MRGGFLQTLCIFAIAIGAGLLAFGHHLDPPQKSQAPGMAVMHVDEGVHVAASMACGLGVGLITGGVLGLAIPWMNATLARCCEPKASSGSLTSVP
jgi:hypothetical protein